jgi:hypothetical protein
MAIDVQHLLEGIFNFDGFQGFFDERKGGGIQHYNRIDTGDLGISNIK